MLCHVIDLGGLIEQTRGMIDMFTKAKAAKLIRELVDMFLKMDATTGKEVRTQCMPVSWGVWVVVMVTS